MFLIQTLLNPVKSRNLFNRLPVENKKGVRRLAENSKSGLNPDLDFIVFSNILPIPK